MGDFFLCFKILIKKKSPHNVGFDPRGPAQNKQTEFFKCAKVWGGGGVRMFSRLIFVGDAQLLMINLLIYHSNIFFQSFSVVLFVINFSVY